MRLKTVGIKAMILLMGCTGTSWGAGGAPGEWINLFDGSAVSGLTGFRQDGFPNGSWAIEKGTLKTVPGADRVDLVTEQEFEDFELEFEWKVSPAGNSGVMYGVSESEPQTYRTGPEYQILDDAAHRDGRDPKTSAGSLYALLPPHPSKQLKPVREFNQGRIVIRGSRVEHWLNGAKVVEYEWGSPSIRQAIANSKFKDWSRFMSDRKGRIAFQHHGEEVWYRNVRVRPL